VSAYSNFFQHELTVTLILVLVLGLIVAGRFRKRELMRARNLGILRRSSIPNEWQ
jgi:hypothetical protein